MTSEIIKDFSAELEKAISHVMAAKKLTRSQAMVFIAARLKKSDGKPYANNRQVFKWISGEDIPHNINLTLDQVRAIIDAIPLREKTQQKQGPQHGLLAKYFFDLVNEHQEMKEEIELLKSKVKEIEARDKYFGLYYKTQGGKE